jgi:serine/threonine-protein kinase RIM15
MSDRTSPRRQPPSPLVFTPETVLPPVSISQTSTSTASTANNNASRSDTVSMPFVKRHVTRRLKTAKAECDKELQRVTNSITAFFEEKLRESEFDQIQDDRDSRGRDRDTHHHHHHHHDSESLQEPFVFQAADLRSALGSDDASSDGGYEAEIEFPRHSRQRASIEEPTTDPPRLTHWSSSPGLLTASTSSSPSSLRRQHTLPRDVSKDKSANGSSPNLAALSSVAGSPSEASPKKQTPTGSSAAWTSGTQGAAISRRLSRSIHMPVRPIRSGQSSRSTSRSRSPLPRPVSYEDKKSRRSSRILIDDPVDPIMTTLYAIISVATDITEMSISQITSQPKICEELVQRVQIIGKAWDEHPDWHGRNWYVQVLLAVAGLSRVIEWWEAEKQFWNFDEKKEDDQDEPLIFVMKPATLDSEVTTTNDPYKLSAEEERKLRMIRPPSTGRKSRDEAPKGLSLTPSKLGQPSDELDTLNRSASKFVDTTESARVLATERLRLQAETAQNHNIVMELSLDGDHIIWINYAWFNVVGYGLFVRSTLVKGFDFLSLLERIQRNCRVLGYRVCLRQAIGIYSEMPHVAFRKMILIRLKFDSNFKWKPRTSGMVHKALSTG